MSGTAIIAIHTKQGFIIAADGLERVEELGTEYGRSTQKIVSINDVGRCLACGIAGTLRTLPPNDPHSVRWDIRDVIREVADSLAHKHQANFSLYLDALAAKTNKALKRAKATGDIAQFPDGLTIAKIIVVGYYNRDPWMAEMVFPHRNQRIRAPILDPKRAWPGDVLFHGSKCIWELLWNAAPEVKAYHSHAFAELKAQSPSLGAAQEAAIKFIEACSDPIARQLDPGCESIGGHIHMAVITLEAGFRWVIQPAAQHPSQ